MSFHLSASSIKDFLVCPARWYYRINYPEQATKTKEMVLGTIVHDTIEKYWDNQEEGIIYATQRASEVDVNNKKLFHCLNSFYNHFIEYVGKEDKIEMEFSVKFSKDVDIVGRIDRISNGLVFDWKTTEKPPENIDNDVQFIIYYESYKKIFGCYPVGIYYVSLTDDKFLSYQPDQNLIDELYKGIIPYIIKTIKRNDFPKSGLYDKYSCNYCSYKRVCRS